MRVNVMGSRKLRAPLLAPLVVPPVAAGRDIDGNCLKRVDGVVRDVAVHLNVVEARPPG
jgi:hypothetical protein